VAFVQSSRGGYSGISVAIGIIHNPHGEGEQIMPPLQGLGSCGTKDTQGEALGEGCTKTNVKP
jgi:hypothetical protein